MSINSGALNLGMNSVSFTQRDLGNMRIALRVRACMALVLCSRATMDELEGILGCSKRSGLTVFIFLRSNNIISGHKEGVQYIHYATQATRTYIASELAKLDVEGRAILERAKLHRYAKRDLIDGLLGL